MCQINTEEMKKQIGCIDVLSNITSLIVTIKGYTIGPVILKVIIRFINIHVVPPDIDDVGTSSDVIVNENDDAKLVCKAYGHPTPVIKWLREDKKNFSVYDNKQTETKGRRQSIQ